MHNENVHISLHTYLVDESKHQAYLRTIQKVISQERGRERERVHLGELVRGTAGDLSDAEESELSLEILQLAQQIRLRLLSQLMNLHPRCNIHTCIKKATKLHGK